MAGLLDVLQSPEFKGMSQGLLAAGQPSPYPVGFGQVMGSVGQGIQSAQDQAYRQKLQQLDMMIKMQEMERKQQSEAMRQKMLEQMFQPAQAGTQGVNPTDPAPIGQRGGIDAEKLAAFGLATGDSNMLGYAKFLQDRQQVTPYQQEMLNIKRDSMDEKQAEKERKRAEMMDAEGRRANYALGENNQTISKIDELLNNRSGIDKVTGLSSYLPNISDAARNAQADIDTLKSRSAFGGLQEMRVNSPTGGALGQVAVQELEMLKNAEASLQQAQSEEEYVKALENYKASLQRANQAVADAYQGRYGQAPAGFIPSKRGSIDVTDPRVRKAKEVGYTDEEIQQYLNGGR